MHIKLFISQRGRVLMTSDRYFTKPIEVVIFDAATYRLAFKFEDVPHAFMLNCPIDDHVASFIMNTDICGLGFEIDDEIKEAVYLPLITKNADRKQGAYHGAERGRDGHTAIYQ